MLTVCLILMLSGQNFAKPYFLHKAPQALTDLVTSASAASSEPTSNISDLRRGKLEEDDFFKESFEDLQNQNEEEEMKNEAAPNLIYKKLNKIAEKIRFLSMLTNSKTTMKNDDVDDFQKEFAEFDKQMNEDKEELVDGSGYVYNNPLKQEQSAKQSEGDNKIKFNSANIGVFFMELIGSLVGLVYGAAAQLNQTETTSTTTLSP